MVSHWCTYFFKHMISMVIWSRQNKVLDGDPSYIFYIPLSKSATQVRIRVDIGKGTCSTPLPRIDGSRWLYEPQSTVLYPKLWFPYNARRYRPRGPPFSSQSSTNCGQKDGAVFSSGGDGSPNPSQQGIQLSVVASGFPQYVHRYLRGIGSSSSSVYWEL